MICKMRAKRTTCARENTLDWIGCLTVLCAKVVSATSSEGFLVLKTVLYGFRCDGLKLCGV